MIAVLQCAGRKHSSGRYRSFDGSVLEFVAHPELAPSSEKLCHVHPDGVSPTGRTWRAELAAYNSQAAYPFGLLRAGDLYSPPTYRRLVDALGWESVYILSAGWGLVRSDFRLPHYDITFSKQVKEKRPWSYRRPADSFDDFSQLPQCTSSPIFFFGGHDYVPLFCELTAGVAGSRTVFYKSAAPPRAPGCKLERFVANRSQNWQYDCVEWFVSTL